MIPTPDYFDSFPEYDADWDMGDFIDWAELESLGFDESEDPWWGEFDCA